MMTTCGVLHLHSAPSALCPHIEWAVGGVFGLPVRLEWEPQPVERSTYQAEYGWTGPTGTAARLASALKGWQKLRFEATEQATLVTEAERYAYTPTLGVFHAVTGPYGDLQVPEDRIRHAIAVAAAGGTDLAAGLALLLGEPWDRELDPFRHAAEGAGVRWLHEVV